MFKEYDDLISLDDLCRILNISRTTAYRLLQTNQLQAFKIGRIWKIPKKAVEQFILSQSGLH